MLHSSVERTWHREQTPAFSNSLGLDDVFLGDGSAASMVARGVSGAGDEFNNAPTVTQNAVRTIKEVVRRMGQNLVG